MCIAIVGLANKMDSFVTKFERLSRPIWKLEVGLILEVVFSNFNGDVNKRGQMLDGQGQTLQLD